MPQIHNPHSAIRNATWWCYEVILCLALAAYVPSAVWRRRLPHRGWGMRMGRYPRSVTEALRGRRSIWVHAVSVGEVLACQPVIRELTRLDPDAPLVLSTVTPAGFTLASSSHTSPRIPVYSPLDFRLCVRRALEALRPRILVLMESELWPVWIEMAHARGVPIVVVNGRVSPRAFARSVWIASWLRTMLSRIDAWLMQSQADADRIIRLGAPPERVRALGNLKWEASLRSRPSEPEIQATATTLGLAPGEPVLIAGSTHRGEEAAMVEAFQLVRRDQPALRLILAPRHLERVNEVEHLVARSGLTVRRFSRGAADGRWEVGLVDTLGQLPRYYGVSTVAVIGGSFIPHGGQNPLEAASLGKPIVVGPFMHNFADIAAQLVAHQAARQLESAARLAPTLQELLAHPDEARAMGRRAAELLEASGGVTQRTLEALRPFLTAAASPQ